MTQSSTTLVQKLWSYCTVLRDDGLSYQDYMEQLTMLLFLKMAEERSEVIGEEQPIPEKYRWANLAGPLMEGERLEKHYRETLQELGKMGGMLGLIYGKAQNKIQDPAKLRRLIVDLIDQENWLAMSSDVKGDAYEGLLERNAQDVKGGAGQYFTPRPLIDAIVDVIQPQPGEVIADPACGTAGFLLSAHRYLTESGRFDLDFDEKNHLRYQAFRGVELVEGVARLCAMNLYLHGIGPSQGEAEVPILAGQDALRNAPSEQVQVVLTNPPFGKKSSIKVLNSEGKAEKDSSYNRSDFWVSGSNKQLNFIQHVKSMLALDGRAAIVVPDNVLYEGGAGEIIRRKLMFECDLHTILRLPTGIFYAHGVKANAMFFDRKDCGNKACTQKVWFYDLRTNKHFTLKQRRLTRADLDDFVEVYRSGKRHLRKPTWHETDRPDGRWRAYDYDELVARDKANLHLFWLRDEALEDSANLPEPHILATEIAEDLRACLEQIEDIQADLQERAELLAAREEA